MNYGSDRVFECDADRLLFPLMFLREKQQSALSTL